MKGEVKAPIIVVAVVALAAFLFFVGSKAVNAGGLDQGQVKYTPGVPPWKEKDPSKKGPGGLGSNVGTGSDATANADSGKN